MRKFFLVSLVAIMAVASFVAFAAEPPENITLDACANKKAAVEFPHQAHFEVTDCVTCHHTSEGLTAETVADMDVAKCSSCHLEPENADTPNCTDTSKKTNMFHMACIGCHKDYVAEHADSPAPTKCTECHPKD